MSNPQKYGVGIIAGVLAFTIIVSGVSYAQARTRHIQIQTRNDKFVSETLRRGNIDLHSLFTSTFVSTSTLAKHHAHIISNASSTPRIRVYSSHSYHHE